MLRVCHLAMNATFTNILSNGQKVVDVRKAFRDASLSQSATCSLKVLDPVFLNFQLPQGLQIFGPGIDTMRNTKACWLASSLVMPAGSA